VPRNILELVLKLLAASLAVGLVFSLLDVNPWQYLGPFGPLAREAINLGSTLFRWAWTYVILGAAAVVPLWLLYVILSYLRKR
jgi:xanthosine utilization system XapX-like protein